MKYTYLTISSLLFAYVLACAIIVYINTHMHDGKRTYKLYAYHLASVSLRYYIETRNYNIEVIADYAAFTEEELQGFDFLYLQNGRHTAPENFQLKESYNERNFLLYEKATGN